ncbi:MAG: DNA polymerase III subunit delta' [Burkholderiaceae bacterium]|jgi:DNA polymerase-3 subunit delta'|nr:DNA polymerase III subunit delta' [Burkholderiaceae bacterium]
MKTASRTTEEKLVAQETGAADADGSVIYPWQEGVWTLLQGMRKALPHALLLYGAAGTGKRAFAEHFAKSLLCETQEGHACSRCAPCRWFEQYAHPDYRRVQPDALEKDMRAEDTSDAPEETTETAEAVGAGGSRPPRALSKIIRIDQIRALRDLMGLSTHRGGPRVVCIFPAEALERESANALLKMLEEPPAHTLFILVSNTPHAILPTILSRCCRIAMPMPDFDMARTWLRAQGVETPEIWLAEQGGAPVSALEAARTGDRSDTDALLDALASPDIATALKMGESVVDRRWRASAVQIVTCLQRWLYDLLLMRMTGTHRYFPQRAKTLGKLAERVDLDELLRLTKKMGERKRTADHPLVLQLLIEDMLLDYNRLFPPSGK